MTETITIAGNSFGQAMQKNPWRVVGVIAERLGVLPTEGRDITGGLIVSGAEYVSVWGGGDRSPQYDINEVAIALLDRLDEVASK